MKILFLLTVLSLCLLSCNASERKYDNQQEEKPTGKLDNQSVNEEDYEHSEKSRLKSEEKKTMNSKEVDTDILGEIIELISTEIKTNDNFEKFMVMKIKNISKKTITSLRVFSDTGKVGASTFLIKKKIKPSGVAFIEVPVSEGEDRNIHLLPMIEAVRFSDGSAIDYRQ